LRCVEDGWCWLAGKVAECAALFRPTLFRPVLDKSC
jgi:hypothetical protein